MQQELMGFLSKETRVLCNASMKDHTSFKIGGVADFMVIAATVDDIKNTLKFTKEKDVPLTVIGNCTNLLIRDGGIRGIVLKTGDGLTGISLEGETFVRAMAGETLARAAVFARDNALTGFEFAHGIPGSVGGAVYMNAGAYGGEMKNVVQSTRFVTMNGEERTVTGDEHDFSYRESVFSDMNAIIVSCDFSFTVGDKFEITTKMDDFKKRRRSKQPLDMPSAGSVFKRPEGDFAGRLIELSGLRGVQVGGAQVSQKHCGFIVNTGNANAKDVLSLIELIQQKVYKRSRVLLECELKVIGED